MIKYHSKSRIQTKIKKIPASVGIYYLYHMQISEGKKIYFSSDNHLGAPTPEASLPREKKFVKWLDEIKHDAAAIFLLGDLFKVTSHN